MHSTKTFKNLETGANCTEISEKSFQKFHKLLNFRNANHSEIRGTQREYSSKPRKHSTVKRILVFKRKI